MRGPWPVPNIGQPAAAASACQGQSDEPPGEGWRHYPCEVPDATQSPW